MLKVQQINNSLEQTNLYSQYSESVTKSLNEFQIQQEQQQSCRNKTNQALNYKQQQDSTKIIYTEGHRGAGGYQNNLNAFQSAIDHKLDCIELDVWLTNDNKLAITHGDDDGNIKKNGQLVHITSLDLIELQKIYEEENIILNEFVKQNLDRDQSTDSANSYSTTCGSPLRKVSDEITQNQQEQTSDYILKQKIQQINQNRIPELKEVLELTNGKIRLNIELKDGKNKPLMVKQVIELIYDNKMEEQVQFSSFDYEFYDLLIKQMKEYNYIHNTEKLIMPFGFLVEHEIPERLLSGKDQYLLFGNSLNFPAEFLQDEQKIEQIKQLQQNNKYMSLKCWFSFSTEETEKIYDSLREIGCQTIITNDAAFINNYKNKNNYY